jgi:hypothetical protein
MQFQYELRIYFWSFDLTSLNISLQTTHSHMKENQNHMDVNDLWNYFKNSTTDSIKKNITTKSIGNKTTLPWVTPQIKKLINKTLHFSEINMLYRYIGAQLNNQ